MPLARPLTLFLVLLLASSLAGCNFRDFYNQEGTIRIEFRPVRNANQSAMNEFQKVTVAVGSVTIRQVGSIDPKTTTFRNPILIDAVEKADKEVLLAEYKTNLRATGSVIVRMDVIEAIDAAGRNMKICHEGRPIKNSEFPCFFVPENFAYIFDRKPIVPPRGGTVDASLPFVIKWAEMGGKREYYFATPPDLMELQKH